MKRFLRSGSFKTLVVIAVVIVLGIVCAAVSHNAATPFTTVVGTVFSPLQRLSAYIAENLNEVDYAFESSDTYREENEKLEQELAEYRRKLAEYDDMKKKVDAYEEFYGVKQKNPDYEFCYGSVISKDAADAYDSMVLNVGSGDGVSVGDPVIYGEYVVGIVKKANYSSCVVYSVLDPRVNIGAYESGTKEYGYVSGEDKLYESGLCKLYGLDSSTSVVAGGVVCTSGAGGVFPNGLIIGEVETVKSDDVSAAYYAEVKPYADFSKVTDVFVITSFAGQGEGEAPKK